MAYKAELRQVRAIVNAVDPIGLIAMGAPEDEYDPEVADLVRLRGHVRADEVVQVFVRWFGEDGQMEREHAASIAAGINTVRSTTP